MLNSGQFRGVRHHLHEDKIIGLSYCTNQQQASHAHVACEHFFWNALMSTNCTTALVLLGPPQWGIKREKKSFRSIDPLSRTPRALDLTRSALHARCSVHIQCADRKSSVHCMPCSKKTRLKLLRGGCAPTAPSPPWIRL